MKNIFLLALAFIACFSLSACSLGNHTTDSDHQNTGDSVQAATPQKIDAQCEAAVSKLSWKDVDKSEAAQACQLFHTFLLENYEQYKKIRFTTHPAAPYYFMEAHIEREISPFYAIHAQNGVINKGSTEAMQAFFKHIDILNTTEDATKLAKMSYVFHAKDTENIVTNHEDAAEHDPEQNPPEFHKNDDGSATLTYDLQNMGRSMTIRQCVITVQADYQTTLSCAPKK